MLLGVRLSVQGTYLKLAGRLGIEPRLEDSKSSVLPLDDLPKKLPAHSY